jgi:hypothetical protein
VSNFPISHFIKISSVILKGVSRSKKNKTDTSRIGYISADDVNLLDKGINAMKKHRISLSSL